MIQCSLLKVVPLLCLVTMILQAPATTTINSRSGQALVYCDDKIKTSTRPIATTRPKPISHGTELKLNRLPQRFSRPTDVSRQQQQQQHYPHYLPKGPPPYKPPSLMIMLGQKKLSNQLPTMKWKMQRRKIHDTFLDVMRVFHRLADQLAGGKIRLTTTRLHLIQAALSKIATIGGKSLKMKWPLVMLNPNFLKELLSSPTFLVMLFHAIEVGYMSSPTMNVWLKPLVSLVKQPSPEKEERTWWRRKRLYETFNGIGSSELQPNLKTIHFRRPGKPTQASLPILSQLFPNFYDKNLLEVPKYKQPAPLAPPVAHDASQLASSSSSSSSNLSEMDDSMMSMMIPLEQQQPQQQLLSQEEFEALDEDEKQRILREAKQTMEESLWTNELIQQQNSFVDSLMQNKLDDYEENPIYKEPASGQGLPHPQPQPPQPPQLQPQKQAKNTQQHLYRD